MRSKVLSYLLSLSLIFCVGYGSSLTASAYTGDGATVFPVIWHNEPYLYIREYGNFNSVLYSGKAELVTNSNAYSSNNNVVSSVGVVQYVKTDSQLDFNFSQDLYDYYLVSTVNGLSSSTDDFTFFPDSCALSVVDNLNVVSDISLIDTNVYTHSDTDSLGFTFFGKIPELSNTNIYGLYFSSAMSGSVGRQLRYEGFIVAFPKGESVGFNDIVAAIQDQSSFLGGKIDSAVDDIQQSIEDQYGGDPGSSFPVDDIIMQHNEKMGVLSFGSDTLMQVLGLLSPDQSLSSELVFPSMSLTIAGQRNKVQLWPEYRFDLNELKQHWPDFVGIMQSLTTALVWIFVLRYCYRVFEKYFLAGGGN